MASPCKRLDEARKEIRVLRLLPGLSGSIIRCTLRIASLMCDSPQPYEALSYAWGESRHSRSIRVHQGGVSNTLPVTDNLFAALNGLRPRFGLPRELWVDAVCINQADLRERSPQVLLMSTIYSSAKCVNIWLGAPITSEWTRLNRSLHQLKKSPVMYWPYIPWPDGYSREAELAHYVERLRTAYWIVTGVPLAIEEALADTKPRWSDRLWVVQECVLAAKVNLCYGRTQTPYHGRQLSTRRCAWKTCCGKPIGGKFDKLHNDMTDDLNELIYMYTSNYPGCLLEATQLVQNTRATDLRDRVYGLLGMLTSDAKQTLNIAPDYALKTWQVYSQATFASWLGRRACSRPALTHSNTRQWDPVMISNS